MGDYHLPQNALPEIGNTRTSSLVPSRRVVLMALTAIGIFAGVCGGIAVASRKPLSDDNSNGVVSLRLDDTTYDRNDRRRGPNTGNRQGNCFPGEAVVHVLGRGPERMASLRAGDSVLAEMHPGDFAYEPILGFLHQVRRGRHHFLTVSHSEGQLRASRNHLVFVVKQGVRVSKTMGELKVGEWLVVGNSSRQVLDMGSGSTELGMFAPLTASGTLVVDGSVVSVYAQASAQAVMTHAMAHVAFFPARAFHTFAPGIYSHLTPDEEMHGLAELFYHRLFLHRFLEK